MNATISPQLADVYAALRTFIQGVVGPNIEVIEGLGNRVPMPAWPFIAMTAIASHRQATNVDTDTDLFYATPPQPGITSSEQSTQLDLQLDFYGPLSNSWATMIGTLFRDDYACEALAPLCQPLYADDPQMMPLTTAEDQYLERWTVTASIQYNPVVVTGQTFAATLDIVAKDVDVIFPPSGA